MILGQDGLEALRVTFSLRHDAFAVSVGFFFQARCRTYSAGDHVVGIGLRFVFGAFALLSGFRIRDTALMLAGLTIAINIGMHDFWNTYPEVSSDRETQNFVKNLAIFAGLLVLSSVNSLPQFRISRS